MGEAGNDVPGVVRTLRASRAAVHRLFRNKEKKIQTMGKLCDVPVCRKIKNG